MIAKFKRRGRGPAVALVAHHEAGHACIAEALGIRVTTASIVRVPGQHRGIVKYGAAEEVESIVISFAGVLAAARSAGRPVRWSRGGRGRRSAAVQDYGGSDDLAKAATTAELDLVWNDAAERRAYLRWLWQRARVLVERHWPMIEAVAAALVERRTLTGEEVRGVRRAVKLGLSAANGHPKKKPGTPGDGACRAGW